MAIIDNLTNSVRHLCIETDVDGYEYFTYGGTITLVKYKDKTYGLTCGHVVNADKSVSYDQLCILNTRDGIHIAGIENVVLPKNLADEAVDSDLADICILEFSSECTGDFFSHTPHELSDIDIIADQIGDQMYAVGAIKQDCGVDYETNTINSQYVCLPIHAQGKHSVDPILYKSIGKIPNDWNISELTGMSGGAIYNANQNHALTGIIARAGVKEKDATIFYISIVPFLKALQALENKSTHVKYNF
tara:strand:- start:1335 stop:2075 length:741 start_codon:yes stop_codon:yes gene_type:complete